MADFELTCEGCGARLAWDYRIWTKCQCTKQRQVLRAVRSGFLNKYQIARVTRFKVEVINAYLSQLHEEGLIARVEDRPAGMRNKFPYDYYIRDSPQDPKNFDYAARYAALLRGDLAW